MKRLAAILLGAVVGAVASAWFTPTMDGALGGAAAGSFVAWLGEGILRDLRAS